MVHDPPAADAAETRTARIEMLAGFGIK